MLKRLGLLGAVAAMAIASPASATKTFVLQDVILQGTGPTPGSSATLEGSFSTSDDLTHLEAVNITASAGNYWFNDFTAFTFDDALLADWVSLPTQGFQISIGSPTDPDQQLHLVLLSFTETGGDIWTGAPLSRSARPAIGSSPGARGGRPRGPRADDLADDGRRLRADRPGDAPPAEGQRHLRLIAPSRTETPPEPTPAAFSYPARPI